MLKLDPTQSTDSLKVIIMGSGDRRPKILKQVDELRPVIEKHAEVVLEDLAYCEDLTKYDAHFAIVLGGDGSILRAAKQLGDHQIPVLGVNLGKLGFLADIQPEELEQAMRCIASGEYALIDHLMIYCELFENDTLLSSGIALNDVSILGGPPFQMQQMDLFVDGKLATSYSCDGLIISTPVGSTAHNLSAGGPILRKNLQAFVISPISPHTLTVRPIVDTADRIYEINVRVPNESTCAVLDGQIMGKLTREHRVKIRRANSVFQLIQIKGNNYYQTLSEKLGWGGSSIKQ